MRWIWIFLKRIGKYLFRSVTFVICLGKTCRSSRISNSSPKIQFRSMTFPSTSTSSRAAGAGAHISSRSKYDFSPLRIPARFVGEVHLVLSALVVLSCIITLISLSVSIGSSDQVLYDQGFILFISITLIISLLDIGFSFLLIIAAKQVHLDKCLLWYRSTLTILILFSLLTISFAVLLRSGLVVLGLLPSLIFKPFALWIVSNFIEDIYATIRKSIPQPIVPVEARDIMSTSFSMDSTIGTNPGSSSGLLRQTSSSTTNTVTTSIGSEYYDRDEISKKKTTVFLLNKKRSHDDSADYDTLDSAGNVVTLTKIKSLPDE